MAERRMFTKKITESDAFLDMPSSTQMLYFHLSMNADDDGFANNPKKIQRMCGASDDDFRLLIVKRFVILFESGIIVIKHWKMHNYIQSDRYRPTDYMDEKSMLGLKKNKSYTMDRTKMVTPCIQGISIEDEREGKESEGEVIIEPEPEPKKKQTQKELLETLLLDYNFSDNLLDCINDWIAYKRERSFVYKERGLKSLLKNISEKSKMYGETAVATVIDESISCGYQGIVWDKLKKGGNNDQCQGTSTEAKNGWEKYNGKLLE